MMATRGLICVSIMTEEAAAIPALVAPVSTMVDVVEIRLDGLFTPLTADCISTLNKPVLVTNRPTWEGGRFTGNEEQRVDLLLQAVRLGARYADIELQTSRELRDRLLAEVHSAGAEVIVSHHDFRQTPPADQLTATLRRMMDSGADIGKIVTTATTADDVLRVLDLQRVAMASGFRLSAFCMGAPGTISRLATLYLGGWMTYVALAPEQATAPGQLTAHAMHALTSLLEPA
jgi:3-dehydroquinate dehydratase-1/3-dehydroquinate dehydratase/shikimate dehydrogenase